MGPGPARPIPFNMPSAGAGIVLGIALRETSGTNPAVWRLHSGTDTLGGIVLPISLNPSESCRDSWFDHGIIMEGGMFPELVSGTIEGCYFIRDWSVEGFDYDWQIR